MKKNSMLVVLLTLIVFALVISGCGKSGGGGSKTPNSNDEENSNEQGANDPSLFYKLTKYAVTTEQPSFVNIMFHVENGNGEVVTTLTADDFEVLEDDESLTSESTLRIVSNNEVPYKLYTVLMIDNSISVGSENLTKIKAAAKELILTADNGDGSTGDQYFKIYSFSELCDELTEDFSNDVSEINDAINLIELGVSSTNLYGAVIEGVSNWSDSVSTDMVEEGILLLLSDGNDSQSSSTLDKALTARGDKKIITVGVGSEIVPDVLTQLGNSGFYEIDDYDDLADEFVKIQTRIDVFANNFYWVNYLSPKRGDGIHTLTLRIKDNNNKSDSENISDAEIKSSFESSGFFSVQPGIYMDNRLTNPDDRDTINIAMNKSVTIKLKEYLSATYGFPAPPEYSITRNSCDDTVMTIVQNVDDPSVFTITATGDNEAYCDNVEVTDSVNGFSKTLNVDITEFGVPTYGLIASYKFEGDLIDNSGNENHATGSGVDFTQDRFGNDNNAISIDNKNDFVSIPSVSNSTMTVSMWYSVNVGSDTNTVLLCSDENSSGGHLAIQKASNQIGFYNDGWNLSGFLISINQMYHFVLIKDNGQSRLYIDNELVQDSYDSFNNDVSPLSVIGNNGVHNSGSLGTIDDVRIYDRALTELEIETLSLEK